MNEHDLGDENKQKTLEIEKKNGKFYAGNEEEL